MSEECKEAAAPASVVEITVTSSECDKMPAGDTLVLVGPAIDYSRSGPVCLTAINAIYPWIMLARFDVHTPALDWDEECRCYRPACPCGIVRYSVRRTEE
jgi:uncharacterized repeat protein (TIGR04076 family)